MDKVQLSKFFRVFPQYRQNLQNIISKVQQVRNYQLLDQNQEADENFSFSFLRELDISRLLQNFNTVKQCQEICQNYQYVSSLILPYPATDSRQSDEYHPSVYNLIKIITSFKGQADESSNQACLVQPQQNETYSNITSLTIKQSQQQICEDKITFVFTALSFCPYLLQLFTENVNFLQCAVENESDEFFSKISQIRKLGTQITQKFSGKSSLSLPYFKQLQYLYIQATCDMDEWILEHDHLETIKFEFIQKKMYQKAYITAPQIKCKRLKRLVCISKNSTFIILNQKSISTLLQSCQELQEIKIFVDSHFQFPDNLINFSLKSLSIGQVPKAFSTSRHGLRASIASEISLKAFNIEHIRLSNLQTSICDKHVIDLLLNLPRITSISLDCEQNPLSSPGEDCTAQVLQNQRSVESYCLSELSLINTSVSNKLAQSLYQLGINFKLKRIWLQKCPLITDFTVFILLTSSELRVKQQSYSNAERKVNISLQNIDESVENIIPEPQTLKTTFMKQKRFDDRSTVQLHSLQPQVNEQRSSRESTISRNRSQKCAQQSEQGFSCYVADGMQEEREIYSLQYLSIIDCPQVTDRIFYAVCNSTKGLKFFQFDQIFCQKWIRAMQDEKNVVVSLRFEGRILERFEGINEAYWSGDRYTRFDQLK